MKKIIILLLVGFLLLGLGIYRNTISEVESIYDKETKDLINFYSNSNQEEKTVYANQTELVIEDSSGNKEVRKLPKESFYLSIAPYINETHGCSIHYISNCTSELIEKEFMITITDNSGKVILKELKKSTIKGFVDFWLPRNKEYNIKIEYENYFAESKMFTFENSNTCITNIKLVEK